MKEVEFKCEASDPTAIRPTSGPWKAFVREDSSRPGFLLIDCDAGIIRPPPRMPSWEVKGNANLIAGSWQLLQEAKRAAALFEGLWKAVPWLDNKAMNKVPLALKLAILTAELGEVDPASPSFPSFPSVKP
jgi:hypothetical protein